MSKLKSVIPEFRAALLKIMPGYDWTVHRPMPGSTKLLATGTKSSGMNRISTLNVAMQDEGSTRSYTVKSAGFGLRAPWLRSYTDSTLARALRGLEEIYRREARTFYSHAEQLDSGRRSTTGDDTADQPFTSESYPLSVRLEQAGFSPSEALNIASLVKRESKPLRDEIERLRAELYRSQYTYIGKNGKQYTARELEDERDALREKLADAYVRASGSAVHASDCATSCAPAEDPGPCDCDYGKATIGPIIAKQKEENARLRQIISRCADALGTGAFCAPSASAEFMASVPEEIALAVQKLRSEFVEASVQAVDFVSDEFRDEEEERPNGCYVTLQFPLDTKVCAGTARVILPRPATAGGANE